MDGLMVKLKTLSASTPNRRAIAARSQCVRLRFGETAIAKHAPPPPATRST